MLRWLTLLPLIFLLTLVSIASVARQQPAPQVITIREIYNGRWLTFNQTLDGKYKREILRDEPHSISNLNWSPDGTSMIIVDFDGNIYRYRFYERRLELIDCDFCTFPPAEIHWSEYGSFFTISSTKLVTFQNNIWHIYYNGGVEIEAAHWNNNRIVLADRVSHITSIKSNGLNRITVSREFDRLVGIHDDVIYTFDTNVLYKINLEDQVVQSVLTFEPIIHRYTVPVISPDGQFLIYIGQDYTPYLIELKSGDNHPLANRPLCELGCYFRWSPDSQHLLIYYADKQTSAADWFHVDLANGTLEQITYSGKAVDAVWMPFYGLNWHPFSLFLGAALFLIARTGLRIMF